MISDDFALLVDSFVCQLPDQSCRDAMVMHYVGRMSDRAIGKELGCHHKTVSRLLSTGEGAVQEMLL